MSVDNEPESQSRPNRLVYLLILIIVIIAGLASRKYGAHMPVVISKDAGDVLWTVAVYLLCRMVFPRISAAKCFVLAAAISVADEISQLYHASWIDSIRHTTVGHLFLGDTFAWGDIACYFIGAGIGVGLDFMIMARNKTRG
jgi:hypothetical protein